MNFFSPLRRRRRAFSFFFLLCEALACTFLLNCVRSSWSLSERRKFLPLFFLRYSVREPVFSLRGKGSSVSQVFLGPRTSIAHAMFFFFPPSLAFKNPSTSAPPFRPWIGSKPPPTLSDPWPSLFFFFSSRVDRLSRIGAVFEARLSCLFRTRHFFSFSLPVDECDSRCG